MQFHLYKDVRQFYADTVDLLRIEEEKYPVLLGNLILGNEGIDKRGWRDPKDWFMATVTGEAGIEVIALMTPPHNIALYEARPNDAALSCLVRELRARGIPVPGVLAEQSLVTRFAAHYAPQASALSQATGRGKLLRVYSLTELNPETPLHGVFRKLQKSDFAFLPYWYVHFASECYGDAPKVSPADADGMATLLALGNDYILESEGIPVSTARISRAMVNSCCISMVYTPPWFRKKGHAAACVAQLCMEIFRRGYQKCTLYADLGNPTSNSIYQKLGFRPVCDVGEWEF